MSHPENETLMRYAEGSLERADAESLADHLASCTECRERKNSMHAFAARLNAEWLGARLKKIIPQEWGCPSADELGRYFLDEIPPAEREQLGIHVEGCSRCKQLVAEMDEGTATLMEADPLRMNGGAPAGTWWERFCATFELLPAPAWAGAAVAVILVFITGVLLSPLLIGPSQLPSGVQPYRIAKPPFAPSAEIPAFGVAPSVKPEAEQRFREAMAFYAEPDFADKAIPKLKEAVMLDPRHDQAQFWLGVAYLLKGESAAAVPPLEEAVRLAQGKMEYKQYLVWAYLKTGEVDKALRLQTQILERR